MAFGAQHMSLYQLTLERGTPLFRHATTTPTRSSLSYAVDDELLADLYDTTVSVTAEGGYTQYEISSFAREPRFQSQHNSGYWKGIDYIGNNLKCEHGVFIGV